MLCITPQDLEINLFVYKNMRLNPQDLEINLFVYKNMRLNSQIWNFHMVSLWMGLLLGLELSFCLFDGKRKAGLLLLILTELNSPICLDLSKLITYIWKIGVFTTFNIVSIDFQP